MSCHGASCCVVSRPEWFVYQDGWHLCHLYHLCQLCRHDTGGGHTESVLCRHDTEGGGAHGKCVMTPGVTWVSSKHYLPPCLRCPNRMLHTHNAWTLDIKNLVHVMPNVLPATHIVIVQPAWGIQCLT